jgi:hemerythrin-like domain-containing protein
MGRRHDSLIPLSRQHQHALALAVIIRRRFGMEEEEEIWRKVIVDNIQQAYKNELAGHFDVEEAVLFPEMRRYLGEIPLVQELLRDHAAVRELVKQLGPASAIAALDEFSSLLEAHVRKEERRLFPEFEKKMPAAEASRVGREIEARLAKVCPGFLRER